VAWYRCAPEFARTLRSIARPESRPIQKCEWSKPPQAFADPFLGDEGLGVIQRRVITSLIGGLGARFHRDNLP
jgi:hypothetical protein